MPWVFFSPAPLIMSLYLAQVSVGGAGAGGGGGGGCGVSASEYTGAQINFGNRTPYLTYDLYPICLFFE